MSLKGRKMTIDINNKEWNDYLKELKDYHMVDLLTQRSMKGEK